MTEVKKQKRITFADKVRCVGDVCFDPETKVLRVEVDPKKCKQKDIDAITEAVTEADTDVEIVLPKKKKQEAD